MISRAQTTAALSAYYQRNSPSFLAIEYKLMALAIEAAREVESEEARKAEDAAMWARIECLERRHGLRV